MTNKNSYQDEVKKDLYTILIIEGVKEHYLPMEMAEADIKRLITKARYRNATVIGFPRYNESVGNQTVRIFKRADHYHFNHKSLQKQKNKK